MYIYVLNFFRVLVDAGSLAYPYSLRELVNVVKHLQEFPDDSLVQTLENVFHFDLYDTELKAQLAAVFQKHGIPLGAWALSYFSPLD